MNETLKVKSSLTLRSQRNSGATPSARQRIVPSDPAASSVAHARRWTPSAAAPEASSSRRSTQRQPDTVAAAARAARGQRETVRVVPTTVPGDDLTSMTTSDTSASDRPRQLSNRPPSASQMSGPICSVCRVPRQRCQCPESNICILSRFSPSRSFWRRTAVAGADPVRRTSRGQQDTVPGVTPVNLRRRRERDTVTDIAPGNRTRRRLEPDHVAAARPRRRAMRRPTTSQHSMSLRDSNVVNPNRNRFTSTPQLANNGNGALYEHMMAISRFIRLSGFAGIAGPIPVPHELIDPLMTILNPLTTMAFSNDDLVNSGGMAREEICQLPVRKVPNSAIPSQPCTICLKDYERGDMLRVLPCCHEFHQKCLDQWLAIKRNCPVCRKVL